MNLIIDVNLMGGCLSY